MKVGLERGFVLPLRRNTRVQPSEEASSCLWISQENIVSSNLERLRNTLKAEPSALKYWILLAFSYKCSGDGDIFENLLKEAEGRADATGKEAQNETGAIYSALAVYNYSQAQQFSHHEKRHVKHMDMANHYMSLSESSEHYTSRIASGQCHISNFIHHHQLEEYNKAKDAFQSAMLARKYSIATTIYYANTLVLGNQYDVAAIYYMRALMLCNYLEMMLKLREEFVTVVPEGDLQPKLYQLEIHVRHMKALILFALACCKYYNQDIEEAEALMEASLRVQRTPQALRLQAAIAAIHLLEKNPDEDEGNNSPTSLHSERELLYENMVNKWSNSVRDAYFLDPTNGIARLHHSEFLFQHGLVEECENKLNGIKRVTIPAQLQSELNYQFGKCAHVKDDKNKAYSLYNNVLSRKADYIPARMQLIKVAIASGKLPSARNSCETMIKYNYRNLELLRLAGITYVSSACETLNDSRAQLLQSETLASDADITSTLNNIQRDVGRLVEERLYRAMGFLEEAIGLDPTDQLSQEYYISCLELLISRGRESLFPKLREAYTRYSKMGFAGTGIEFRNNDAVVALRSRDWAEGLAKLMKLWEEIEKSPDVDEGTKITVQFNLAVANEENGNTSRAHKMYSHLNCEYPQYVAAWLRKSNMALQRGDMDTAHRYLEQLKSNHKKSVDPWVYKAYQFFHLGKYDDCIEELQKLFRTISHANFDAYANTLFSCALIRRANRGGFNPLPKEVYSHARAALRRHTVCNFYAANCVAIYLAHGGHLRSAQESFGILLENPGNTSNMKYIAHRNMGLLCAGTILGKEKQVERGAQDRLRTSKAHQHLHNAINHGRLEPSLHFIYTRFLYDCQRFEECAEFIESCRLLFPNDNRYLYNLVVVLDSMLCRNMRNSDKLASTMEVTRMLTQTSFLTSATAHLMTIHGDYAKMSHTHLQQIATRVKDKLIPHLNATLPQLEAASAAKQLSRGKQMELQLSIQQANEAKKAEMELERQRAAEAERMLSEKLLKQAFDIASEITLSRPPPDMPEPTDDA